MSSFHEKNLKLLELNAEAKPDDDEALNAILKNQKSQDEFFEQIEYLFERRMKLERLKNEVSEDKTSVRDAFRFKTTGYIDVIVDNMVKNQLAKELNRSSQKCDILGIALERQLAKDAENG